MKKGASGSTAKVIEPACFSVGLEPVRADKIARPGEITEQVFAQIHDADIVIADVTGGPGLAA